MSMNQALPTGALDSAAQANKSNDSLLHFLEYGSTREAEVKRVLREEIACQRALPYVNDRKAMAMECLEFVVRYCNASTAQDPHVRLSGFLLWIGMQYEKAEGVEPVNTEILFDKVQGYYMADVDLISFSSIEENPTGPKAPHPRTTPRYIPVCRAVRANRGFSSKVRDLVEIKHWRKYLPF